MGRLVRVRLTPEAHAAVGALAESLGETLERVCLETIERHLAQELPLPSRQTPRPRGVDLVLDVPWRLWLRARSIANAADVSVGQLCRFAVVWRLQDTNARPSPVLRAS